MALNNNTMQKKLTDIVPAKRIFTHYCPTVKNWRHKCSGIDGNGKPITFSPEDQKQIKAAKKQIIKDIENAIL
jgi:hypothetical protein